MHLESTAQRGFTLIELSIVLVIIGLIVGGMLVGQDLIRTAQLRSVVTDLERFRTAVNTFYGKYNAYPGDMPNATQYWGAAGGNVGDNFTSSCYGSQGTGTQTCNGNGNGLIDYWGESFAYWKHLADEGLVAGNYTGVAGSVEIDQALPGVNVPLLKFGNAGVTIINFGSMDPSNPSWAGYFPGYYGNTYFIGIEAGTQFTYSSFASPKDLLWIDTKLDDGLPGSGQVMTSKNSGCASTTDPSTAVYTIQNAIACQMYVINLF